MRVAGNTLYHVRVRPPRWECPGTPVRTQHLQWTAPQRGSRGGQPVGSCASSASTGMTWHHGGADNVRGGFMSESEYQFFVGVDWGSETHVVCVLDPVWRARFRPAMTAPHPARRDRGTGARSAPGSGWRAATRPSTASELRKRVTSGPPSSAGWRLPWKKM